MSDKQGIEIDYCPECRGVWLDRGELEKIIERSSSSGEFSSPRPAHEQRYSKDNYDHDRNYHQPYKKKKKSPLSELFDF
jgi:Zn-finger nucleic acid-binding protein